MNSNGIVLFLYIAMFTLGCGGCETKEKIHKAGEMAGEAAGELIEGVKSGVSNAFDVQIEVSPTLTEKGIALGKSYVDPDSSENDNRLIVYLIFNQDVEGSLTAKVFDSKGLEMGRCTNSISAKSGDARYIEFLFDRRTDIDHDSKLILE